MYQVIIVDDEKYICHLIAEMIDWTSMDMRFAGMAHDGSAALDLMESVQPDIVISDIQMPGLDGIRMLEELRRVSPDTSVIFVSGYSNFEYVQEALRLGADDYLLKPIRRKELASVLTRIADKRRYITDQRLALDTMTTRMRDVKAKLNEEFLRALWEPDVRLPDRFPELNERYMLELPDTPCLPLLIKLDFGPGRSGTELHALIRNRTCEALTSYLAEDCYLVHAFFEADTLCVVAGSDDYRMIVSLCWRILRETAGIRADNMVSMTIAVHTPVAAPDVLPDAVRTCRHALCERYLTGGNQLIETAHLTAHASDAPLLTDAIKQAVHDSFRPGSRFDCGKYYGALADTVRQSAQAGRTGVQIYDFFCELTARINSSAHLYLPREETAPLHRAALDDLDQVCSIEALTGLMAGYHDALLTLCRDRRSESERKPIRDARQYISVYYAEPLSLADVAEHVGYNQAYLSKLFPQETGQNFSDYLTDVRITRAKELLRDREKTAEQIAYAVGYNNPKYFYRIFKKKTNLTVREYRELYY